ncbi:hypothetical protein [Staphylococcus phage vB_SepM_ phiIPLA-C1C]|jgi:hypothetical protein|uniref:Phage PVL protein n=2 Tax=Sepunavirus TaxID=1980928 RepID=A0A0D3MVE7_9CAUD|nr:hypothetical protein AVU40_gp131 [Staphylococcus phage phiIPLA-C1C]AJA42306.1 hypothetical protein [Staphylococcus phage phiIPLA-C1C]WJJ58291.1 hypothetical protein 110_00128 [Staphylococcus phage 110]
MVKIKREVEMTFPELIEYGLENGIKNRRFTSNRLNSKYVSFDALGGVYFNNLYSYLLEDTFTVEVEEEITKDTKLDSVLEIYTNLDYTKSKFPDIHKSVSINDILGYTSNRIVTKCIYLVNEDDTMTLIWKDGELVK